jgi:RimK family alpha-L-glutamate ligase
VPAVAIVGGNANETNLDLASAWRDAGLDATVLAPSECREALGAGDVALGRVDVRRSLDGVEAGLLELLELRRRGIRVLNPPATLLRTHDKLLTARALAAADVPHPATEHVAPANGVPQLRPPVVVKPRFGSWGADVHRCDSQTALRATIRRLSGREWFRRQGALVQTLVPPVGNDLRVLVAGGRVVGAESRVAAPHEWRTNISLGGSFQSAVVPPRAREHALAAAAAVSGDFVGIDLLPCDDGYVVIEVNGSVDFDRRYSLPGTNVFGEIAAALGLLVRPRRREVVTEPVPAPIAAAV